MKKFLLTLFLTGIMTVGVCAGEHIYISTVDCSNAAEHLKSKNDSRLSKPVKIENTNWYMAAVNTNDEIHWEYIVDLDEAGNENGGWSGDLYDSASFNKLKDGDIYTLIADEYYNIFAVSDSKSILLGYGLDYDRKSGEPIAPKISHSENRIITDILSPQNDDSKITVIDGNTMDIVNKNDRILLPLRDMGEILNCDITWEPESKTAAICRNNITAEFTIGSSDYTVNNEKSALDTPAEIINDKTYVPLRAAGEALNADITYNKNNKRIILTVNNL